MGKVKGILEEDMARNPDLYDGGMDYEYWSYINGIARWHCSNNCD